MTADKSKMTLWTRYFDSKLSRSEGRRVPKEASIPSPSLDSIVWAARDLGLSKMKRDLEASHPSRPHLNEGRLILSTKEAISVTNADSKEGVMQSIGLRLRRQYVEAKNDETPNKKPQKKGDKQVRSQRKSFKGKNSGQRKKRFGRK
uniref:Signal recognition particle protein Srp19 n=1 Tax=uncultured Poseidoniia archaeon TaxID=1697135 RepID=A0A1B1TFR6_9ARCH|nr:signal recognition particle protein Srp19 [uncultured Candidatus Thalassoarchaea sp.]